MLYRLQRALEWLVFGLLLITLLAASNALMAETSDRARAFTRPSEFDYFDWTLDAFSLKLVQAALGSPFYFDDAARHRLVRDYLDVTGAIIQAEYQLELIYTDPQVADPAAASTDLRAELGRLSARQAGIAPAAEAILQEQVSEVVTGIGLAFLGQPLPPLLFHISPLPYELVVSPRNIIRQEASISLLPDLSVDRQAALEEQVDSALDVSSLAVPVGGIGSYPTMVMRTTALDWLTDTIAPEWIHNYLTLRPLGFNYEATPELRTMNETAASIAGGEIAALILSRYYPELAAAPQAIPVGRADPHDIPRPVFDYRAEMHATRVTADALLAEGKIEEAEAYMEARRQFFWENGCANCAIRKLNQAYFAFYGAYADEPGGAAGEDPVGPAVRALRQQSASLAEFIRSIARMDSYQDLLDALAK